MHMRGLGLIQGGWKNTEALKAIKQPEKNNGISNARLLKSADNLFCYKKYGKCWFETYLLRCF